MMDRFSGVSSPAWISAVHPTILVSESPDWHLFRFSCLLCPIAANVAPKKRQVQKADLRITFGIPCSRIGTNTTVQSLSPPFNVPIERGSDSASPTLRVWEYCRQPGVIWLWLNPNRSAVVHEKRRFHQVRRTEPSGQVNLLESRLSWHSTSMWDG